MQNKRRHIEVDEETYQAFYKMVPKKGKQWKPEMRKYAIKLGLLKDKQ